MKLECSIEKIKNALNHVERMTGKNLTLPVLGSILWVAKGSTLILRATNLSIGIEITIPAKVEKEGVLAIRGDVLTSLFSVLVNDTTVSFEQKEQILQVKTKFSKINLKTIGYEDFPTLPIVQGDSYTIPVKNLYDGLKAVSYSAAISEIKPEIGSIYMYPDSESLVFVATDSFRLAEKRVKNKHQFNFSGVLLPFKNVQEVIKVLENNSEDVEFTISKNQASFKLQGIYITSRVVDGIFPDYKQIIPKNPTSTAIILKQDLLSALKVSNVLSDTFNQVTLRIDPSKKECILESKNNDIGENSTSISAALTGEAITLNFNYKYILDSFQSINSDSVALEFYGANKPMIMKGVGDPSFLYVVMPMNR
jgi:DNA polymerase-3 subunit beta